MNPYKANSRWKTYLGIFAILIILASLVYTNFLVKKIEQEERAKMNVYASTLKELYNSQADEDVTFYFDILNAEKNIPLISVNEVGEITSSKNLRKSKQKDEAYLNKQLQKMKGGYAPIVIPQPDGTKHQLYYSGSELLRLLRWFPYVQLFVIGLFLLVAYSLFSQARKSEQNQIWVGMSKETAHQLGTPIFSILGWLEYLKLIENEEVQNIVPEMEKDLKRLELITDRFSKIGSVPKLEQHNLVQIVDDSVEYMKRRSPRKVEFFKHYSQPVLHANLYPPLFNWVLENLIKNALDAMEAQGEISITITDDQNSIYIDVEDTGKGIKHRNKQIVFRPGFSTKKRGWGLGLSLSKRIVEEYHHGKIVVLQSEKDKGTTFRITMAKLREILS